MVDNTRKLNKLIAESVLRKMKPKLSKLEYEIRKAAIRRTYMEVVK